MNIPSFSTFGTSLNDKIPSDMKTISVVRRHNVVITHAVPAHRVLDAVPALPHALKLDVLPFNGESCAFLQTILRFNDDLHYTPLPLPNLDFWQIEFGVLVRRATSEPTARQSGFFVLESFCATRAAWVLGRALAGEARFAQFNIVMRQSLSGAYEPLIADVQPENGLLKTQIAVRETEDSSPRAPFVNREKMTDFLMQRPFQFSALSVGQKFVAVQNQSDHSIVAPGELVPVGAEVPELKLGFWETLGILQPNQLRVPYDISIQAERKTVLQSPGFL